MMDETRIFRDNPHLAGTFCKAAVDPSFFSQPGVQRALLGGGLGLLAGGLLGRGTTAPLLGGLLGAGLGHFLPQIKGYLGGQPAKPPAPEPGATVYDTTARDVTEPTPQVGAELTRRPAEAPTPTPPPAPDLTRAFTPETLPSGYHAEMVTRYPTAGHVRYGMAPTLPPAPETPTFRTAQPPEFTTAAEYTTRSRDLVNEIDRHDAQLRNPQAPPATRQQAAYRRDQTAKYLFNTSYRQREPLSGTALVETPRGTEPRAIPRRGGRLPTPYWHNTLADDAAPEIRNRWKAIEKRQQDAFWSDTSALEGAGQKAARAYRVLEEVHGPLTPEKLTELRLRDMARRTRSMAARERAAVEARRAVTPRRAPGLLFARPEPEGLTPARVPRMDLPEMLPSPIEEYDAAVSDYRSARRRFLESYEIESPITETRSFELPKEPPDVNAWFFDDKLTWPTPSRGEAVRVPDMETGRSMWRYRDPVTHTDVLQVPGIGPAVMSDKDIPRTTRVTQDIFKPMYRTEQGQEIGFRIVNGRAYKAVRTDGDVLTGLVGVDSAGPLTTGAWYFPTPESEQTQRAVTTATAPLQFVPSYWAIPVGMNIGKGFAEAGGLGGAKRYPLYVPHGPQYARESWMEALRQNRPVAGSVGEYWRPR